MRMHHFLKLTQIHKEKHFVYSEMLTTISSKLAHIHKQQKKTESFPSIHFSHSGRLFQSWGVATAKARSPQVKVKDSFVIHRCLFTLFCILYLLCIYVSTPSLLFAPICSLQSAFFTDQTLNAPKHFQL